MDAFFKFISTPGILVLVAIWIYLFIYAFRKNTDWPFGFVILLIGVSISGQGIIFQNDGIVFFWLSTSLMITLFGSLLNIIGIRNQLYIVDKRKTYFLSGIGIIFVLLIIPVFTVNQVGGYVQGNIYYTPFAQVFSVVQLSIAEEFLFRGYLLSYLKKYGFNLLFANSFQSLVFAIFHIQRYSDNWILLSILFLFGILAGFLTQKSDNLMPATLMHVILNSFLALWLLF